jgi:hypothetical protein
VNEYALGKAVDLDALYRKTLEENIRGAAYKTVATFAGLTRRRLWLKDGNSPRTDGHEIIAPFEHKYFYQIVEHELSHVLFQSNGLAKKLFIESYLAVIDDALKKANTIGLGGVQSQMAEFLNAVVGVLEDIRCESLWALLYPGSYELLQACHREEMQKWKDRAHMSLGVYFTVVAAGIEPPPGRYSRFLPYLLEAMGKVKRRSFGATLAVSKWLVQHLVSEALREMRGLPPPPKGLPQDPSGTPSADHVVSVEPVVADVTERFEGMKRLVAESDTPSALFMRANDTELPKYPRKEEAQHAKDLANFVARLNTNDAKQLEDYLTGSEAAMNDIVAEAREALGQQMEVDDWITKNAFGKVNLKDVPAAGNSALAPEDRDTVQKLRAVFFRVMGRRKYELHEQGSIIDVPAYIEARLTRQPVPCFQAEEKGRGFKVILLIDRSGSMAGAKTKQAERACRILAKALDFPFVEFHIWGFQSIHGSELDITRFDTKQKDFTFVSKNAIVSGNTPLHLALRVCNRFMEAGAEAKQIICLTDGFPTHVSKKGNAYGTKTLSGFVREEVRHARRLGMNVTGVLVGRDVGDDMLSFMFGPTTNWRRMPEKSFGDELVRLVSTSFVKYLRNG